MASDSEILAKQSRIDAFLDRGGYDAVLLGRLENFSWFGCGADCHVNTAQETGVGALLVRRDRKTLITNNVERPRLLDEELAGQGFDVESPLWAEDDLAPAVARLAPGEKIASDISLPGVTACPDLIAPLRYSLTPEEVGRYRAAGAEVGVAIAAACMDLKPGMTEHEAAAALADQHLRRGLAPIVVLVAADDRLLKYRHPIPTDNKVERTVMLVVCARRYGLVVSATRIVSFGPPSAELRKKHDAVAQVDAAFIAATQTGARIGDVFKAGLDAYAAQGFADEWQLHHQGGPAGYLPREYRATMDSDDEVLLNQVFAWNPSIKGTKSEDTIVSTPDGPEIISASPDFPTVEASAGGLALKRADILVR